MSQSDVVQKVEQLHALLAKIQQEYVPAVFANSFGAEDMVLTDLIARHYPHIAMFTLDTGRLPQETYDLMQTVKEHYGLSIQVYFPEAITVENYVAQYGPNGFYQSVELRKRCCYIRKVEPLRRALAGKRAWITGMRREQAITRDSLVISSFDAENDMQKFNPLCEWSYAEVWAYLREHDVPYSKLHDCFYPSIGCTPCTRAITPGEDVRSGRWWWENPEFKECGLHVGKVAPIK